MINQNILNKIAKKIISFKKGNEVFIGYKGDEKDPENGFLYTVYDTGFIEETNLKTNQERIIGQLEDQIQMVYDLPQFTGWDDDTGLPILKKNHGRKPENDLNPDIFFKDTYHFKVRHDRLDFIDRVIGKSHHVLFVGYKKEPGKLDEIHVVKDNGIIEIYNPKNGNKVTKKISRPGQILEVYRLPQYLGWDNETDTPILNENHHKKPPINLKNKTEYYQLNQWNEDLFPLEQDYEETKNKLISLGLRKAKIAKRLIKIAKELLKY